jgi:hypothetical protein
VSVLWRRPKLLAVTAALLLLSACGGGGETPAPAAQAAPTDEAVPTLYWLDIWEGSVYTATGPDFDDPERLVHPTDRGPDGVSADVEGGKLYWTSMGDLNGFGGGSLQRADLDGANVERIVEPGVTRTPKQMQLDLERGHVYWSDREGAAVWRATLDGADARTVLTGHGNQQLVGLALDVPAGKVYVSDRTTRRIFRMGMDLPPGQTAADRTDVEELHSFPEGAMPIDLDVDEQARHLYWTDRALGTVNRSGLDVPPGQAPATRTDTEVLVSDVFEPIGISLDVANDKLYYAQSGSPLDGIPGLVLEATLDGTDPRELVRGTMISGVALVHLPPG